MNFYIPLYLRKNIFLYILLLLVLAFFIIALLSPVSYGGADDIVHYRFARYSFKYPQLLLDHWAKPVFTLLASPFAQLGYWGVKLFNILTGALTSYLLFRIAGLLRIKRAELVIIFLFFTPVYTTMLMSGMTEILFSAILTLAAFLFLKKQYIWSAIAISFLPLVRTEGIVILPIYLFGYILYKQWKAVPFILTASIIYSLAGGLYFKDFLWLITHIPYTGTYDIYGHGELFHFVKANKVIFGIPLTLLFLIGLFSRFSNNRVIAKYIKEPGESWRFDELIVILAPLVAYYCAHSYVWWKGINSLGLIRVMAGVSPLFVIYSLRGFNFLLDVIPIRTIKGIVLLIFIYFIAITPFKVYEIQLKLSDKDKLVKNAADWYKTSAYKDRKYYIWDCYFYFILDTNPYDPEKMADGIPDRHHPENLVKPGEIVIWDAHFSAVDGRFPLSAIIDNPWYKLVKVFRPQKTFIAGGGIYQLCFFERLDTARGFNNRNILDSLTSIKLAFKEIFLTKMNFKDQNHPNGIAITKKQEFFMLKEMNIEKQSWNEGDELNIKLSTSGKPMILAISVGNNKRLSFYQTYDINTVDSVSINEYQIALPEVNKNRQKLKVYLWNQLKNDAEVQNVEIKLQKICGN